jgi:hypothetical protein
MKERAKEKKFNFPYLYDSTQKIGLDYGATKTPEVFLLDQPVLISLGNGTVVAREHEHDRLRFLVVSQAVLLIVDANNLRPVGGLLADLRGVGLPDASGGREQCESEQAGAGTNHRVISSSNG